MSKITGFDKLSIIDDVANHVASEAESAKDRAIVASLYDRTFSGIEPNRIIKLPYYYTDAFEVSAGVTQSVGPGFALNSIWDPEVAVGGHQPKYRDMNAAYYNYYKVLETRFKIQWISTSYQTHGTINDLPESERHIPMLVTYNMAIDTAVPNNEVTLMETMSVTSNEQQIFGDLGSLAISRNSFNLPRETYQSGLYKPGMFDTNALDSASNNEWTAVGSNPTNLDHLNLIVSNTSGVVNFGVYRVWIEYLVSFKQLNRNELYATN